SALIQQANLAAVEPFLFDLKISTQEELRRKLPASTATSNSRHQRAGIDALDALAWVRFVSISGRFALSKPTSALCQKQTSDTVLRSGHSRCRAMACMSRKEIPRCRTSSQRTIRIHLTLSNRVRRPMAASCG